jgi:hypothetical protein
LLRRFRDHVKTHNWFAVGIDLLIVMLGVFLGTQVSNWNSDRLARQTGAAYRDRIARDVHNNQADMEARSGYFSQVRAFGLQVLDDLDGRTRLPDAQFLIAAYQATQIYPRPMNRAAYDEVLSTGALDTVGDPQTREKITNYYLGVETSEATFRSVPQYREIVRSAIPYHVQERIREACAEILDLGDPSGLRRMRLPEHCDLGLPADEIARAAARVRGTAGLELALTRQLADLDQKLIQADRERGRAVAFARDLATAH